MSLADDVAAVKAVLQARGWVQGDFWNADGACCLLGATIRAGCHKGPLYLAIRNAIGEVPISYWNDFPGRTVEDVYALLDAVAQSGPSLTAKETGHGD